MIETLDRNLLLYFNGHHNSFWDTVMWFASGELSWLPLYAALLVLIIAKYRKKSWLMVLMVVPLIVLSDQLASGVIKPIVHRLRPSHEPHLENLLHYINNYKGGTYGFVSSHASNVFALTMYLTIITAHQLKWLPYILFPWAVLVSFSRVYLGVHYPSDVIVAALVGILSAWIIAKFYFYLTTVSLNKT